MTDALREALLREALGHLKGYKMSMLARTRENLIAAIERALQEPAPVVAREPDDAERTAMDVMLRKADLPDEWKLAYAAGWQDRARYRSKGNLAAPQAPVEPAPVVQPEVMPLDFFADWFAHQAPPRTVISDPAWWAPRIYCAIVRAAAPSQLVEDARAKAIEAPDELREALAFGGYQTVMDVIKTLRVDGRHAAADVIAALWSAPKWTGS